MSQTQIFVRQGTIEEVVRLSQQIPEFDDPHQKEVYQARLQGKKHLIAIAEVSSVLAGFKVGYDKFGDSSFYTWMGGVLPGFRKLGVARALAEFQEAYVRQEGFDSIILKTRNRYKNMLLFAISSGFEILGVEERIPVGENRILLKKVLES